MALSKILPASIAQPNPTNFIINGAMNVAQRATSSTGIGASSGYFTTDRWKLDINNTAGRLTMTQDSSAPSGFHNSTKLACTTADTSIASDEYFIFQQRIEGQNLQSFAKGTSDAKPFALSFYVKGNASATYTAELFDGDNSRQISKTFTVGTDWSKVELSYPADTTGAFDDDNANSFNLNIWIHCGSNYKSGTLNSSAWASNTTANRVSSSNTSFVDSTDRTFFITGVQLEVGQHASEFIHEPYERTLAKCQRYYAEKELHQSYMDSNADSAQYLGYDLPVTQRADGTGSVITQVQYWSGGVPTNVTPNVYPKTDHIRITTSSLSSARGIVSGRIASDAEL